MAILSGVGIGDRPAVGPAYFLSGAGPAERAALVRAVGNAGRRLFSDALARVTADLRRLRARMQADAGADAAAIFGAHLLILDDPLLLEGVEEALSEGLTLGDAVLRTTEALAAQLAALPDAYLGARSEDVRDLGMQLLDAAAAAGTAREVAVSATGELSAAPARDAGAASPGGPGAVPPPDGEPWILVIDELTPSLAAALDRSRVAGIVAARGQATSHAAILARSLDIPTVLGCGPALWPGLGLGEGLPEAQGPLGRRLAVLPRDGRVMVDLDAAAEAALARRSAAEEKRRAEFRAARHRPAVTQDGLAVEVSGNAATPGDARAVREAGGDGIGLLRTEFLYLDRQSAPGEAEQVETYRQVLKAMAGRPVIFRTLDVGGDKPIPFLPLEDEPNPFLGRRGFRLWSDARELLETQLRALVRAILGTPPPSLGRHGIMFPMVATLEEVEAAGRAFDTAWTDAVAVSTEGRGHDPDAAARLRPQFGVMLEVPSLALVMDHVAARVDFVSVGTNDLAQYTLAADRTNPAVAGLLDAYHPAVLRLVADAAAACHRSGKWLGVCGESGGDRLLVPFWLGVGVVELSMAPARIPEVKGMVRATRAADARGLADRVLALPTGEAVRNALEAWARQAEGNRQQGAAG